MALAFDDLRAQGVGQAFDSVAEALSRITDRRSNDLRSELERALADAEREASMAINRMKQRAATGLTIVEKAISDGYPINIDRIIKNLEESEDKVRSDFKPLLNNFSSLQKMARAISPEFGPLVKSANDKLERFRDAQVAEYRGLRNKLCGISERIRARTPFDSRIDRAEQIYTETLRKVFGYAKVASVDIESEGDYPVYVMKVLISSALYEDVSKLLSLEQTVDQIIQESAPDLAGFLAVQFEPINSASQ